MIREELSRFAMNRWIGLHCQERDAQGRPYLIRYLGRRRRFPLRIEGPEDVDKLLSIFRRLKPRTFYATANVFGSLHEDFLADPSNIVACTPTWDVDNEPGAWRATLEAARELYAFLEQNGVSKSVFIKWSGKGCHVHLKEGAISEELRKRINPLDLAYAIVEYVNLRLRDKFLDIALRHRAEGLKIENEMDIQRLFTCPLSLHRELNKVCVCISPNDLDAFTPEWADPGSFKHYWEWSRFEAGEADGLAMKAYEAIGGSPRISRGFPRVRRRAHPPLDEQIARWMRRSEDNP
ncbi:MAG: hypothetical protein QXO92_01830 [Candidatus Bathyarchaeia archaeon]